MTMTSLTQAVESYTDSDLSLTQAAAQGGVSEEELVDELRSQGVSIDDDEQDGVTSTRY
jgi:predicted HTH domain antitoxin